MPTDKLDILKTRILKYIEERKKPLPVEAVADGLGANPEDVQDALDELELEGRLFGNKADRYGLPRMMNLIVGRLKGNERGFAFIIPEDPQQTDAYVGRGHFGTAIHGDRVVGRVTGNPRGEGLEAQVIRVLARARETIVGSFKQRGNVGFVDPLDRRIHVDVVVPYKDWNGAQHGEIVVAQVLDWEAPREVPVGAIIEVLGDPGDPGVDILAIVRRHELPDEFPEDVLEAAEGINPQIGDDEWSWRRDLSEDYIVTIDPIDAKDFDDAVSLERTKDGGWRLGVHIADVSHYVKPGGVLDDEAFLRGNSVYLVDRVLPMLPERLSNFICSLRPKEHKRSFSVFLELDPEGRTQSVEALPTAINSRHRLWYELAQDLIEGKRSPHVQEFAHGTPAVEVEELTRRLRLMNDLARILRKRRLKRGAIDLDQPEAQITLDPDTGEPLEIKPKKRLHAHQLIEEFMLAANEAVAKLLTDAEGPTIYRVHDKPDDKKLDRLAASLRTLGVNFKGDLSSPRGMMHLIKMVEGKPLERLCKYMLLRSLPRAVYSPRNIGHFGLASGCYTHFTSPIRRYADLVVHRQLSALHHGGRNPYDKTALGEIALQTSQTEELAEEAERESITYKKLQYLTKHLGEVFAGTVTGVLPKGFFVELDGLLVEGRVPVNQLEDDYYRFEEDPDRLVGNSTGNTYRIGDRVKVQVVKVDMALLRLDLVIDGTLTRSGKPKRRYKKKRGSEPHWMKYAKGGRRRKPRPKKPKGKK
ncbi:MAG: ribonuclease R [Candidatus Coatesbacteria bacterium]|nr:ribonuclease R [Candidatus Coatesbacteria bacterium]